MAMAIGLLACGGDDDRDAADTSSTATRDSSTTTDAATTASMASSTTTTSPDDQLAVACPAPFASSSHAQFDDAAGTYAATVESVDAAAQTVSFDVVQWLVGQDAVDAYHQDHPDDPEGPPNDYYVVNVNQTVRTAPIGDDATVALVRLHDDGNADVGPGTVDELPSYLGVTSMRIWWLTFDDGQISGICEQYTP